MSLKLVVLSEPVWGKWLLSALNGLYNMSPIVRIVVPFTADFFLFLFPFYLAGMYLRGVRERLDYYKNAALTIFFSGVGSIVVNLIIQLFVIKSRPEAVLQVQDKLIMTHLPTDPFPSDHAAMTAAIAMATRLRGKHNDDKTFVLLSYRLRAICIITSVSRVIGGIHWPTDIIAGIAVGVLVAYRFNIKKVYLLLKNKLFFWIITIEKKIFKILFRIDQ